MLIHLVELEPKDQVNITSLPVDETKLKFVEHMPQSIPELHSPIGNGLGLVSDKFFVLQNTKTMACMKIHCPHLAETM